MVALKAVAGVLLIAVILIGALPFYLIETVLNIILVSFQGLGTTIAGMGQFIINFVLVIIEMPFNTVAGLIEDALRNAGVYIYIHRLYFPRVDLISAINLGQIDFALMGINKQFSPIGFMMAFFLPIPSVANTIGVIAVVALVIGVAWFAFSVPKLPSGVVARGKQWVNRGTYKVKRWRYRRRKVKAYEKRYGKKWAKRYKKTKKW